MTSAASPTETTVRVGTRDIFVARFGHEIGSAPAVMLLHGGGPGASGVANWRRNIDALAEHFAVIVPDMPGYGRSTKQIDLSDPFGDLAAGMGDLLEELGIEKAHLVGNSYGGGAALRMALDRPDRVDRMVLNGPGGIGTTRRPPTKGLNALLDYYGGEGPTRQKMADFIRTYLVADGSQVPDETIDGRYQDSLDPEVVANPPLRRPEPGPDALKTLWRMDLTRHPAIKTCETPTLVLWGRQDAINRPSGGEMLTSRMRNCDLYMVANVGHWVQWETPELFNRLAIDFLRTSEGEA
ncbi:MAG TPA: alpha/beta fold hydrolase [Actinomycetota bacterium]|nr:alpha/beta fold hydrolase [Actinomycetota bacterium]HRY10702.1 alpha/beta fold hydrolase [Candidatus Nanopelagicales bacterium]HUM87139.1 alpha/beta fold hydrolase [Actinomycetota bacterium]